MTKNDGGGYLVGYKRPPRDKQFQKGRSGNPSGPRPGARSLHTLVRTVLNERLVVVENGHRKRLRKIDAIIKQFARKALSGDLPAARLLLAITSAAEESDRQNGGAPTVLEVRRVLAFLDEDWDA
jgi:hypothetical protein